jgi:hypothetical protein
MITLAPKEATVLRYHLRGYDLPTIGKLVGMKKESVGCFLTNIKNRFGIKERAKLPEALLTKEFEVRDKRQIMHNGNMKRRLKWGKRNVKSKKITRERNTTDTSAPLRCGVRPVCLL